MKDMNRKKNEGLEYRHRRIRKKLRGTAERPRLVVCRSLNHMVAQIVDDDAGRTLVSVTSTAKALKVTAGEGSVKMRRSELVGGEIAKLARERGITKVAFDRGGRQYHGRVKAVADAARKGGLEF
jgi:large subunit ribosomal protein L18